jgi:hypothetical protein
MILKFLFFILFKMSNSPNKKLTFDKKLSMIMICNDQPNIPSPNISILRIKTNDPLIKSARIVIDGSTNKKEGIDILKKLIDDLN